MEPELPIVGTATNGTEAINTLRSCRPDVALLDLEMLGLDGAQVAERIAGENRALRCIVVTRHARPGVLWRALAVGEPGFVSKSIPAATLVQIIRRVHQGGRYVDPELAMIALETQDNPLTHRELEVLRHVRPTATATDVGRANHLSSGTVRNFLSLAQHKLGVPTRLEAADRASRPRLAMTSTPHPPPRRTSRCHFKE